jgi:hypothetical protein
MSTLPSSSSHKDHFPCFYSSDAPQFPDSRSKSHQPISPIHLSPTHSSYNEYFFSLTYQSWSTFAFASLHPYQMYPNPILHNYFSDLLPHFPTRDFLPATHSNILTTHLVSPAKSNPSILLRYKASCITCFLCQVSILLLHLLYFVGSSGFSYRITPEFNQQYLIPP